MPEVDDRYRNPWATWESLSYQGEREVPSAIAANFFTGYSNGGSYAPLFTGIQYVKDDRHSLYFPNLQNADTPPAPPQGDPRIELVSPPEGTIKANDLIVVRYSNLEDIGVGTVSLYVTFCLSSDEGDQLVETRECLLVHDGDSFRYIFHDDDSETITYDDGGRSYIQYTVRNIRGWPPGLITRFEGRSTDGTGASL